MPLKTALFAGNARLERASRNAPPIAVNESDRTAVCLLQIALSRLGFDLPLSFLRGSDRPDGLFGLETGRAVRGFQQVAFPDAPNQWDGIVGTNTLALVEQLLIAAGGDGPAPNVKPFPAILKLLVQMTTPAFNNARTFSNLTQYSGKAKLLLDPFGLTLDVLVNTTPVPNQSPVDLSFPFSDPDQVRKDADKTVSGQAERLRVIFCPFTSQFSDHKGSTFGRAEGLQFDDFTLINTNNTSKDFCTLLHEMIHATGLRTHDTDPSSVFSLGDNRTVLRPEHAERFSKKPPTFFGAPKTP
jgi:Putative peptidoglycan binding domain